MVKQYTPEELTQLHQVLYEILEEIVRICDKHNIPYFVIGGTVFPPSLISTLRET